MVELDFKNRKPLGLLSGFIMIAKIEMIALINNLQIIYNELLTPVLSFLFLSLTLGKLIGDVNIKGESITYINYTFIGIIARLTFSQMYTTVYRVVVDRKYNLLSYKYYMGISPISYVLGMSIMPIAIFLLQSIVLYLIGLIFNVTIGLYSFVKLILFAFICQIFWCGLGICISLMTKDYKTRDLILNILLIPLSYAAPIFYVLESVPKAIQVISMLNPLTYQLDAMRSIFVDRLNTKTLLPCILIIILVILLSTHLLKRIEFKSKERK